MLVAFVWHENRTADPMLPLDFFRSTRFSVASGVYAVMYAALAGVFFFVTLLFQDVKGWSALRLGLSWLVMNLPFLAISIFAGRLTRMIGTATCWIGVLLGGLGILDFAFVDASSSFWQAVPGYLLIGFGYGMAVPTLSAAAMQAVPAERSGVGAGVLNTARQAGASVGLAVLGSISLSIVTRAWRLTDPAAAAGQQGCRARVGRARGRGRGGRHPETVGRQRFSPRGRLFRARHARGVARRRNPHARWPPAGAFLALRAPRPAQPPALPHQPTLARYEEAR